MRERTINVFRDPLDVIFRQIPPEALMESIEQGSDCVERVSVNEIERGVFDRCAQAIMPDLTADEVELIWRLTSQNMHEAYSELRGRQKDNSTPLIFNLLTNFTKDILIVNQEDPVYDISAALRWRDITLRLGQDLFTTAHYAKIDVNRGFQRTYFAWPLVLRSNDSNMRSLMKNGSAENHFHLEGSVPTFHLSWVSLMNHPEDSFQIDKAAERAGKMFRHNLQPSHLFSFKERRMNWSKSLITAAWIRAKLFQRLENNEDCDRIGQEYDRFVHDTGTENRNEKLFQSIQKLRKIFGRKELAYNRQSWCLDYADSLADQRNDGLNTLLVGERYFLYRCLKQCFLDKDALFGEKEKNLFYLYLLIKNRFRSEIIQVNDRPGFRNFLYYQNRKSVLWSQYPEYQEQAYRMAINQTIIEGNLSSLEARISPSSDPYDLIRYIYDVDRVWLETREQIETDITEDRYRSMLPLEIWISPQTGGRSKRVKPMNPQEIRERMYHINRSACCGKCQEPEFFYVLHFIKTPLEDTEIDIKESSLPVRHQKVRKKAQEIALSTAKALELDPYLCTRIRGIDAASTEIGCRPENFATEFRFLSNFSVSDKPLNWHTQRSRPTPLISMTYHVGEDYHAVEDGLRAIDEAVSFLNLGRGSRIGHGLAMGVDPEKHYQWKGIHSLERKQDRLDNLVWLLFRASEWSVPIPSDLQSRMTYQAEALLSYIYDSAFNEESSLSLRDYYEAWKLRGDHPDLIKAMYYGEKERIEHIDSQMMEQYRASKENHFFHNEGMTERRSISHVQKRLAFDYLYNVRVRIRGQEVEPTKINRQYLKLIREMQGKMLHFLNERGIAIESNPSSNLLIGSFDRYDNHPVFRFYNDDLMECTPSDIQMNVSINTDDQGVFATSLENEYSLLASSMYRMTDENGKRLYSNQTVLRYLGNLQNMGKRQVFPSAE